MVSGTSCYGLSLIVLVSVGLMGYPQGCTQFDTSCTPLPGVWLCILYENLTVFFGGNVKDLTFLGVEFHKPVLLPLLKSVQVQLKVASIRLSLYSSV